MSNHNRFYDNDVCKCMHIQDGSCKQCSACTDCEYFSAPLQTKCDSSYLPFPGFHVWGGQFRNDAMWRRTH